MTTRHTCCLPHGCCHHIGVPGCGALHWPDACRPCMQSVICQAAAWHVDCVQSSSDLLLSLTLYSKTCARPRWASSKAAS